MIRLTASAVALLLLLAACGNGRTGADSAAVPRPQGYPRIAVYDSTYTAVERLPLHLEANSSATVSVDSLGADGSAWITVSYPDYGSDARLYLTVSPTTADVIANRRQRMSMNTGGAPTELTELRSSGGYTSTIALTPGGSATPVQLLSIGGKFTLSGAFFLEASATAPDSVRPIVEAVYADLVHASKTLR